MDAERVDTDIKNIYRMGFFDSVQAVLKKTSGGTILVYEVKEGSRAKKLGEPLRVSDVRVEGAVAVASPEDRIGPLIKVRRDALFDPAPIEETVNGLTKFYQDEGYLDAKVTYRLVPGTGSAIAVIFHVDEGPKFAISSIEFTGNTRFRTQELLARMALGRTFNRHDLYVGVDKITTYYYDQGYLDVQVDEPRIIRDGSNAKVSISIYEGKPFHFGSIGFAGDLKFPQNRVQSILTIKTGDQFVGPLLQENVLALADFYADRGYGSVNVDPRTRMEAENRLIDVTFYLKPGTELFIGKVVIVGNKTTREDVVRNELKIREGDIYSGKAIREAKQRLENLRLFSKVQVISEPSTEADRIKLRVNVVEKNNSKVSLLQEGCRETIARRYTGGAPTPLNWA